MGARSKLGENVKAGTLEFATGAPFLRASCPMMSASADGFIHHEVGHFGQVHGYAGGRYQHRPLGGSDVWGRIRGRRAGGYRCQRHRDGLFGERFDRTARYQSHRRCYRRLSGRRHKGMGNCQTISRCLDSTELEQSCASFKYYVMGPAQHCR